MKKYIAMGPISVLVDSSTKAFKQYNSGVFNDVNCGTDLDHAVIVVGYGSLPQYGPYWIMRNSWSSDWGLDGYMYVTITEGEGICGIQM